MSLLSFVKKITNMDLCFLYMQNVSKTNFSVYKNDTNQTPLIYVHSSFFDDLENVQRYDNITLVEYNGAFFINNDNDNDNSILFYFNVGDRPDYFLENINDVALFTKYLVKAMSITDEERNELLRLIDELSPEEIINNAFEKFSTDAKYEQETLEYEIEELQRNITQTRSMLSQYSKNMIEKQHKYTLFHSEDFMNKVHQEIARIYKHKKVEKVLAEPNMLHIYTTDLYIKEPMTKKRYYLGKMMISIPFNMDNKREIKFKNLNNARMNWWGGQRTATAHPHVATSGNACFGNLDNQITDLFMRYEYYDIWMLMLNFLQTCNVVKDSAGKGIIAWDEVDDEGNVVKEGHYDESVANATFAIYQGGLPLHRGDILEPIPDEDIIHLNEPVELTPAEREMMFNDTIAEMTMPAETEPLNPLDF